MAQDLFIRSFKAVSQIPFEYYEERFLRRLPARLLVPALQVNPDLASCRGFAQVQALLDDSRSRPGNPELFPYLNLLNVAGTKALQSGVDGLRIHLGLDPLSHPMSGRSRFWRLRAPSSAVYETCGGELVALDAICLEQQLDGKSLCIYRPWPGLFDDIHAAYYDGTGGSDVSMYERAFAAAMRIIRAYSEELFSRVGSEVSTVAFMPLGLVSMRSFSMRNFYVGGIFVSETDPVLLADQILHEYYHQCLWPWWLIEPPVDLPPGLRVTSPVTGRTRLAATMLQAVLIYRCLKGFYEFVVEAPEAMRSVNEKTVKIIQRKESVSSGLLQLIALLRKELSPYPHASKLLAAFSES